MLLQSSVFWDDLWCQVYLPISQLNRIVQNFCNVWTCWLWHLQSITTDATTVFFWRTWEPLPSTHKMKWHINASKQTRIKHRRCKNHQQKLQPKIQLAITASMPCIGRETRAYVPSGNWCCRCCRRGPYHSPLQPARTYGVAGRRHRLGRGDAGGGGDGETSVVLFFSFFFFCGLLGSFFFPGSNGPFPTDCNPITAHPSAHFQPKWKKLRGGIIHLF